MGNRQPAVVPVSLGIVKAFLVRGEHAAILVDTGFRGSAGHILRVAARHGIAPEHISLILITHGHSDHFGGAALLRARTHAPIAVHALEAPALRRGRNPPLRPMTTLGRLLAPVARVADPGAQGLEPDLVVEGELPLDPFGVSGRVILTPGHTPGSLSVLLSGGEAIIGDLLMGAYYVTHRPDYPLVGDDRQAVEESVHRVLELKPARLHTGHGGPLSPEDVARRFAWG